MTDADLRNAALFAVQRLWRRHGDAVPWSAISDGFRYQGERIPFFSTFEGVYKPRQLQGSIVFRPLHLSLGSGRCHSAWDGN